MKSKDSKGWAWPWAPILLLVWQRQRPYGLFSPDVRLLWYSLGQAVLSLLLLTPTHCQVLPLVAWARILYFSNYSEMHWYQIQYITVWLNHGHWAILVLGCHCSSTLLINERRYFRHDFSIIHETPRHWGVWLEHKSFLAESTSWPQSLTSNFDQIWSKRCIWIRIWIV